MKDFDFDFVELFDILGINESIRRGEKKDFRCFFCGGKKKLNIDNRPSMLLYRCNKCGRGGGMLDFFMEFHPELQNRKESYREIRKALYGDNKSFASKARSIRVKEIEAAKKNEVADVILPLVERDVRYNNMAKHLSLSEDHYKDLRKRGLSQSFIEAHGYRTFPTEEDARFRVATKMQQDGYSPKNLPGFYKDAKSNRYCLFKNTRGIMIPVVSLTGQKQGYQVRKDNDKITYKQKKVNGKKVFDGNGKPVMVPDQKFFTLSTGDYPDGGKMKSWCHFAGSFIFDEQREHLVPVVKKNSIKFTEGPLKADIYYALTNEPIIGVMGVNNANQLKETLKELLSYYPNITTVEDCFDMDYLTNEHVRKAIEQVKKIVKELGLEYKRVTWDEAYKGIDDFALAWRLGLIK